MPPKPPKGPNLNKPQSPNESQSFQCIKPINRRFFNILNTDMDLSKSQIIPANQFKNDQGNLVTYFPKIMQNGYSNLYINGVMQESGIYTININGLTIKNIGGTVYADTPIIIEIVEFFIY